MKMTKQTRIMVNEVNDYLKAYHIKNESDNIFVMMCYLLLKAECYHGFNYFTEDGKLSGGINKTFDHLEILVQ